MQGIYAVEYVVTNTAGNTPGGVRFNNEIGSEYSKQTLISATNFIWSLFQQNNAADRKKVPKVSLFVDDRDGVAFASNNEIHVSARYINGYSGNVKTEITGVLYHESTHIWQWNGNGQSTPGGLIEGIADYVRLKAGYAPSHWVKPGQGDRWDQGYDVTARFLDYCNSLRNGFVAELNKKLRNGYSANFFVELLGKNVDQLWKDYKAKYAK
nr:basic secretory protease [Quercus suber]POE98916.1 basic secretory protease [Quercus suber]